MRRNGPGSRHHFLLAVAAFLTAATLIPIRNRFSLNIVASLVPRINGGGNTRVF